MTRRLSRSQLIPFKSEITFTKCYLTYLNVVVVQESPYAAGRVASTAPKALPQCEDLQ